MSLRGLLDLMDLEGKLTKVKDEIDPRLEISKYLMKDESKTILFENVKGSGEYRVVGNVISTREKVAKALLVKNGKELFGKISNAIKNPTEPEIVSSGHSQEVIEEVVDLTKIPILTHSTKELGPYITSAVFFAYDPKYGFNMSFHRATPISKNELVIRLLKRDLWKYFKRSKNNDLDVAICIGLDPSLLLSAAISLDSTVDEIKIANSLNELKLVKAKTLKNVYVPADAEIILEGKLTKKEAKEGPFVDVTGTLDFERMQPVVKINAITHRKNPIYHGLIPSLSEHKILMGMPKEPTMFTKINKVCDCMDVYLTPGGCKWLHGVIKINKEKDDDGIKALEKGFESHKSVKHLVVVDEDINIQDPEEVEWAIATRFQGEQNRIIIRKEKGSSLDPSAGEDNSTVKIGIDATLKLNSEMEKFKKIRMGE